MSKHARVPGPVPYFECACGWTVGFKRDQSIFGFHDFFGVEPDAEALSYMPKDALEQAEAAVEQHEREAHGVAA